VKILINLAALRQVKWYEHFARFLLGGLISVAAALIAKSFGPTIGGLFLAFPAIFPASATLLDRHEREKKQKAGIPVTIRGLLAVGLDARGAAMGSLALAAFAVVIWKTLPHASPSGVLSAAFAVWIALAFAIWRLRKLHVYLSRRPRSGGGASAALRRPFRHDEPPRRR
jgi:Na+/proline symporter